MLLVLFAAQQTIANPSASDELRIAACDSSVEKIEEQLKAIDNTCMESRFILSAYETSLSQLSKKTDFTLKSSTANAASISESKVSNAMQDIDVADLLSKLPKIEETLIQIKADLEDMIPFLQSL